MEVGWTTAWKVAVCASKTEVDASPVFQLMRANRFQFAQVRLWYSKHFSTNVIDAQRQHYVYHLVIRKHLVVPSGGVSNVYHNLNCSGRLSAASSSSFLTRMSFSVWLANSSLSCVSSPFVFSTCLISCSIGVMPVPPAIILILLAFMTCGGSFLSFFTESLPSPK